MRSLISIADLKEKDVREIIDRALDPHQTLVDLAGEPVSLIFLEPSTRTRVSFECAVNALGGKPIVIQESGSSFEKEETLKDTLLNLKAMGIRAHVIRCPYENQLTELGMSSFSIVNCGDGKREHPTQALLDLTTLRSLVASWDELKNKTLCIVGDLRSSRVARSWSELAPLVGIKLRFCSPLHWKPQDWAQNIDHSDNLLESLSGADFVMALRVQKERHGASDAALLKQSFEQYSDFVKRFQLNKDNLPPKAYLMHPGPINWGVELSPELQSDSRSLILLQVKMGVALRKVVLSKIFESLPLKF